MIGRTVVDAYRVRTWKLKARVYWRRMTFRRSPSLEFELAWHLAYPRFVAAMEKATADIAKALETMKLPVSP